jgi:peptidoglycan/LPS O-acetylase OafA/YrhL
MNPVDGRSTTLPSEIPALTGLRGIAALGVVIYHFWPTADLTTQWLKYTVGRGYLSVDLFFVLSGYVIALNYARWFDQGFSGRMYLRFLGRRIARIYPLYAVILGTLIVFTVATQGGVLGGGVLGGDTWRAVAVAHPALDVPANLMLVQSLGLAPSIITQAWSVSTEFAAYMCFPLLVTLIYSRTWQFAVATGVVAVVLLMLAAVLVMRDGALHSGVLDAYDGTHLAPVMRCMGGFLLGMLAFRAGLATSVASIVSRDGVGLLVLIVLLMALSCGASDLTLVALFPVVVLCLARNRGVPSAIFANPIAYLLGVWSYAMYLLHPFSQPTRDQMERALRAWVSHDVAELIASLAAFAGLVALSFVAYRCVELPGRRAFQRIFGGSVRPMGRPARTTALAAE